MNTPTPETDELSRKLEEAMKGNIQLILERDRWKTKAEEKIALRREVELLLGMESKEAGEEQFVEGLSRLRKTIHENAQLRAEVEMLQVRHAAAMMHTQGVVDENASLRKVVDELAMGIQTNDLNPLRRYAQLPHVIERNTK